MNTYETTYVIDIIIQENLLKINKNMLKLIQLFTSAWRNKNTETMGKKRKIWNVGWLLFPHFVFHEGHEVFFM